jgi:hypothetical protein
LPRPEPALGEQRREALALAREVAEEKAKPSTFGV